MKGPIVFLSSLVLTAVLGLLLVLPLYRSVPQGAAGPPTEADAPLLKAIEGLALAPPPEIAPAEGQPADQREMQIPWDRLPDILRALSGPRTPAPRILRVRALADPAVCGVEVRW